MEKSKFRTTVDGYEADQTDFATALGTAGQEKQDEFRAQIIDPLVASLNSMSEAVALSIIGQSDPADNAGLASTDQRQRELDLSGERIVSAIDYIEGILVAEVPGYEVGAWEPNQQFAIGRFAVGASNPNPVEDGTPDEDGRRRNRAVTFSMVRFAFA